MNVQTLKEERLKIQQRIAKTLRAARSGSEYTQRDIASRLRCHESIINGLEQGTRLNNRKVLRSLSLVLGCEREISRALYELDACDPDRLRLAKAEERIAKGIETLADVVLWHRRIHGVTQRELAEAMGSTATFVSKTERGDTVPDDAEFIERFEAVLGRSLDEPLARSRVVRDKAKIVQLRNRISKLRGHGVQPRVGLVLKFERLKRGLRGRDIAHRAGYSEAAIFHIETGHVKNPRRLILTTIGQVLGVDLEAVHLRWRLAQPIVWPASPLPLGQLMRHLREQRMLRQYDVTDVLGVSLTRYSLWECGHAQPTVPLSEIAKAFGVEPERFEASIARGAS